ncbi:hypothetical protein H4Q26_009373 [Puccinia striiformis f. sp. tritici PST-130]|uniref:Uncharacterized protein n=1 Tax=Puccinia striiformis f. sp. tritici PST-78 TaxID=1165861 RepID=A0A0L0UTJ3_9BASI|nr:hypothetical protein H4Q26_009373 [Puccinia striiformis f. sp. tritici PST-130]KNE90363.1 hypothetical protein PSTG_16186 [Puccinia striiformis f. sp. tritici PST-78]
MLMRKHPILASIAIFTVVNSVCAIPSRSELTTLAERTLDRRDFDGAANKAYDISGLAKRAVNPVPPRDNNLTAQVKPAAHRLTQLIGLVDKQVVMLTQMIQGSGPSPHMPQVIAVTKEYGRLLQAQQPELMTIWNAFPNDAKVTNATATIRTKGQDYTNAVMDIRSATDQATLKSKFNIAMTQRPTIEAATSALVTVANSA